MADTNYLKRAAGVVRDYFVNTFRQHSSKEYCELLTRGMRDDEKEKNVQYPWLYIRLFGVFFLLFAVYVFILRIVGNEFFIPAVLFFGGVSFCLPFTVLLYELYPGRDFSLISLMCVLVLGGTLACVLIQVFFFVVPAADGWLDSFRAGGIEEICKALVAILIIVILKVRNPLLGFLIGAAVGAGYSMVEDMGYMFYYSADGLSSDIPAIISMYFGRGLTAFCTHILWTGLVGFVYAKHDRRLTQGAFYFILLYVIVLHALWDNPLSGVWNGLIIAVCVFSALVPSAIAFLHGSREARGYDEQTEISLSRQVKMIKTGSFFRHGANLTFGIYLILMAVCALVYSALPVEAVYNAEIFSTTEEFIYFAQNGHDLSADWSRGYDSGGYDCETHYVEGVLTQVVQTETVDGYDYYYYYAVSGGSYSLTTIMAEVEDGGATRRYSCVDIYFQGKLYASFFPVNSSVTGYAVNEDGSITAMLYDDGATVNRYPDEYSVVGYVALALTVAETAVYVAFAVTGYRADKHASLAAKK